MIPRVPAFPGPAAAAAPALPARDRVTVLAGLAGVTGLAWVYLLLAGMPMPAPASQTAMPMPMADHAAMPMEAPASLLLWQPWGTAVALLTFAMWAVMMLAMMTPAAAPMILLFAAVSRRLRGQGSAHLATAVFALGYAIAWSAFSALATAAQWGLHSAGLLSPAMVAASPVLGGALLIAAGIYQWTPLKGSCLAKCRSPLGFLAAEWRDGARGACVMGLRHGALCIGCCWALMALLFAGGVMNLLWVAAIAAFVLVEKVAPAGRLLGRLSGAGLMAWGGWMVAAAML